MKTEIFTGKTAAEAERKLEHWQSTHPTAVIKKRLKPVVTYVGSTTFVPKSKRKIANVHIRIEYDETPTEAIAVKTQTATIALILVSTLALAATPYPGDDWLLHKPGTKDEHLADDYSGCLLSPSAPPVIDSRTHQATSNPKLIEAHKRFVLSCMGAKGYVLVPPSTKR